jgi:Lrp/AsnC family leucine-responsive transcriptional regulator
MDEIDVELLRRLQEDGRQTLAALGRAVGLSEAPVQRRVRALEAAGIVRGYVALLDEHLVGVDFEVFVEIQLAAETPGGLREFEERVNALDEVVDCHRTTGDYQYLLRVMTADATSFASLYAEHLLRLPGVQRTRETMSLKRVKRRTQVPLDPVSPIRRQQ